MLLLAGHRVRLGTASGFERMRVRGCVQQAAACSQRSLMMVSRVYTAIGRVPEDELAQKQRSWCSAAAEVLVECPSVAAVDIVL